MSDNNKSDLSRSLFLRLMISFSAILILAVGSVYVTDLFLIKFKHNQSARRLYETVHEEIRSIFENHYGKSDYILENSIKQILIEKKLSLIAIFDSNGNKIFSIFEKPEDEIINKDSLVFKNESLESLVSFHKGSFISFRSPIYLNKGKFILLVSISETQISMLKNSIWSGLIIFILAITLALLLVYIILVRFFMPIKEILMSISDFFPDSFKVDSEDFTSIKKNMDSLIKSVTENKTEFERVNHILKGIKNNISVGLILVDEKNYIEDKICETVNSYWLNFDSDLIHFTKIFDYFITSNENNFEIEIGQKYFQVAVSQLEEFISKSYIFIIGDISELKYKEFKLIENESKLKALMNAVPDIIFVMDKDGNYKDVITNHNELLISDPNNLINKNLSEVLPDGIALKYKKMITNSLNSEKVKSYEYSLEINGELKWFEGRFTPVVLSEKNEERLCLVLVIDITKRKVAEDKLTELNLDLENQIDLRTKQLAQSEKNIKEIIDYAANLILRFDSNGKLIYINPIGVELLNLTIVNTSYTSFEKLFEASNGLEKFGDRLDGLFKDRNSQTSFEAQIKTRSGERKWILWNVRIISSEDSKVELLFIGTDITQNKDLENRLVKAKNEAEKSKAEAEKASLTKSEFIATVSHEIRTPLNAVLGYTNILMESDIDEKYKNYLFNIHKGSKDLLCTLNNILDLSKIDAGKVNIIEDSVNITNLIEDVKTIFYAIAKEKGLLLQSYVSPNTPQSIISDITILRQILVNLVGNAIKFTDHGSVIIKVSANRVRFRIYNIFISVVDTGVGITDEFKDQIFEPFSQGESNLSRKYGGTGLGLSITKRLVNLLGGMIEVKSQVNQGSEFNVSLFNMRKITVDNENIDKSIDQDRKLKGAVFFESPTMNELISYKFSNYNVRLEFHIDEMAFEEFIDSTNVSFMIINFDYIQNSFRDGIRIIRLFKHIKEVKIIAISDLKNIDESHNELFDLIVNRDVFEEKIIEIVQTLKLTKKNNLEKKLNLNIKQLNLLIKAEKSKNISDYRAFSESLGSDDDLVLKDYSIKLEKAIEDFELSVLNDLLMIIKESVL
ncbi:MAG: PAS domain S-box protein [Candidatus Delongbacteria bacterium]|nr:PAS domain S-box protein [Candidatus Delongbacteria bacterium]